MGNLLDKIQPVLEHDILQNGWGYYICIAGTTYLFVVTGKYLAKKITLSNKIKKKQDERKEQLEKLQQSVDMVQNNKVTEISKLSATEIIQAVKDGRYTCIEVLEVFQCKALDAHAKTNCLVQPIIEAKDAAITLGNTRNDSPLFGLPVSIKDNVCYKGYDSTVGCSNWIDKPFEDDCVLVKVLKHQGAIPFVKTNVPQTMLSWETSNPIYGATCHPLDKSRGVGGSSGGEAALIAAGGSVLGFGSDIGGSIRIPASICGVVGLKPTINRLSTEGGFPLTKGQLACKACFGPLANNVDTLVLAMRALCVPKMWELDPTVPPMLFNEEVFNSKKPLKIGYYVCVDFMESVPAMRRGVLEAKQVLQNQGHTVIEWKLPSEVTELTPQWGRILFGDQGSALIRILSVSEWWLFIEKVSQLKLAITKDWKRNGFDAVISPGFTCSAVPLGVAGLVGGAACYTSLYNVLDFPAGSVPVSVVTAQDEENMKNYIIKDPWHRIIKNAMKGSSGLPVSVQVAALPWQEEMCLRVMKELETGVEKKSH